MKQKHARLLSELIFLALGACLVVKLPAGAQEVDPTLLKKEKMGESRPSWWYDVWYENGIVLRGIIKDLSDDIPKIVINTEDAENANAHKFGLKKCHLKIEDILQVTANENHLNSDIFKSGATVDVYVRYAYSNRFRIWGLAPPIKTNKRQIFHLAKVGLTHPGLYYIDWYFDDNFYDAMKKITEARKTQYFQTKEK